MKQDKQEGLCHLCGETKTLCKAHLIPKSLKKLFECRTIAALHLTLADIPASSSIMRASRTQNLEFDTAILCCDCDGKLGIYDNELVNFYKFFLRSSEVRKETHRTHLDYCTTNVNHLYLGFAASLYRHSISQRHPLINLGRYNQDFRIALLGNNTDRIKDIFKLHVLGTYTTDSSILNYINQIEYSKKHYINIYITDMFGILSAMTVGKKQISDITTGNIWPHVEPNSDIVRIQLIDQLKIPGIKALCQAIQKAPQSILPSPSKPTT